MFHPGNIYPPWTLPAATPSQFACGHVKGAFFHLVERVELEPHISTSGWQQLPMNELISEPENKVVT